MNEEKLMRLTQSAGAHAFAVVQLAIRAADLHAATGCDVVVGDGRCRLGVKHGTRGSVDEFLLHTPQ